MSKSLEKIRDIKSLINEVYQDELNEGARKSWLVFQQYCDDIKQDLELLEQLKQQRDSLAINNGELCVKVTDLQKENQELLVNKNLAQKLAVEYKNKIDKLEKENQKLKEKLELTETARQLLYNELKCCNGISEYAQKLKKVIEILKVKAEVLEFGLEVYKWSEIDEYYYYDYEFEEVDYEGIIHYTNTIFVLTQQEYELLKEVINND